MSKEQTPFATSDTPLAAYLYMKGMTVLDALEDPADQSRQRFVFIDVPERQEYEKEYRESGIKEYRRAYKTLIRMLKEKQRG